MAARLGITEQGTAKILREMVDRRYVERRPDPDDARVKRLRLARRGREALAAAKRFHAGFEQRLVRDAGAGAVRTFRRLLQTVARTDTHDDLAHARLRAM